MFLEYLIMYILSIRKIIKINELFYLLSTFSAKYFVTIQNIIILSVNLAVKINIFFPGIFRVTSHSLIKKTDVNMIITIAKIRSHYE